MTEAPLRRLRDGRAVLLVPGPELRGGGLARGGHVLGQELHLLRHAAPNDLVVLVEAHRQRLAVEDLALDLVLDDPVEFLRRGLAPPLRLEDEDELAEIVVRPRAPPGRPGTSASCRREAVNGEQQATNQKEMNQGLVQQALHEAAGGGREPRGGPPPRGVAVW